MKRVFVESITTQVFAAIENGQTRMLLWGLTAETIEILSRLKAAGIIDSTVVAVVDPSPRKHGLLIHGCRVEDIGVIGNLDFDLLVICYDEGKEEALQAYSQIDNRLPAVIVAGMGHQEFHDPVFERLSRDCLVKSYANGYRNSLIHLYQAIAYLSHLGVSGHVAEFGTFKGGTTEFLAKVLNHFGMIESRVYSFDALAEFPPRRSVLDLYTNPDCEFSDRKAVEAHCERNGIRLIIGDIAETYSEIGDIPLILSFFDTDNYSPAIAALEICREQTVLGGVIAFDHFVTEERFIYTIGERMAARKALSIERFLNLHETGIFIKMK